MATLIWLWRGCCSRRGLAVIASTAQLGHLCMRILASFNASKPVAKQTPAQDNDGGVSVDDSGAAAYRSALLRRLRTACAGAAAILPALAAAGRGVYVYFAGASFIAINGCGDVIVCFAVNGKNAAAAG